jgi:hypothetical protein
MKQARTITAAATPHWLAGLGLALLLTAAPVWAQDFNQRLLNAQQAAASGAGAAYDASLNTYLPGAVHACMPKGAANPSHGNFALVADVAPNGHIHNIDVAPQTSLAQCFATQFGKNTLPTPPANAPAQGWPIFAKISFE